MPGFRNGFKRKYRNQVTLAKTDVKPTIHLKQKTEPTKMELEASDD